MSYIIGIDSGGTSTKTAAYDENGELLAEATAGFGNLLNNEEKALQNIRQSIDSIFTKLNQADCELIVLGAAGVDSGNYKETIQTDLARYNTKVVILNDAWMAHYALLQGQAGCLVISGTGSIMIGRHQDQEARVGGWGNLLGDEGSGYAIAKALIQKILHAHNAGRPYSSLEKQLLQAENFATPFELTQCVYSASKDRIAEWSLIVANAAQNQNTEAITILNEAGKDLTTQTALLIEKLEMMDKPKIAVTGSVLLKNDTVYTAFKEKLQTQFPNSTFVRENITNTIGGYYYYKQHKK